MSTSSGKAKSLCKTLGKPSEANAKALATLFPSRRSLSTKQPLEFDPTDKCVVDDAHRRKKAATPCKVRTKRLKVVMLSDIQPSIPKGSRRQSLMKDGRILEVAFRRCMMSNEVMEHVRDAFKDLGNVSNFQFLRAHQDNMLQVAEDQLDGLGVIKLAGCGSLYVKQSDDDIAVTTNDEPKDKVSVINPHPILALPASPALACHWRQVNFLIRLKKFFKNCKYDVNKECMCIDSCMINVRTCM